VPPVDFNSREQEYWYHVSPQEELPLAGAVNIDIDLQIILNFFQTVASTDQNLVRARIAELLIENIDLFSSVRQFLGISDKRAYLDLSYIASRIPHPSQDTSLCGCHPWTLARHPLPFFVALLGSSRGAEVQRDVALMMGDYLLKHGLEAAAPSFSEMSIDVLGMLYARLISPKEYQQRAAKRRGHGCESALASVLASIGLNIVPLDKATNPMGARDPNLDLTSMQIVDRTAGTTRSFDMVVNSENNQAAVLVQSLIHTSDPGQYGVNKSDETVAIIHEIQTWRRLHPDHPVELWALLDGVGFSENKPDTINKLLSHVDFFVQINSLYKAALRAHELGLAEVKAIKFLDFYTPLEAAAMAEKYVPEGVTIVTDDAAIDARWLAIAAGQAIIFI